MDKNKALKIVAAQCSKRECAESDVVNRLKRWELSEKEIAEIVSYLRQHRFLDTNRYAKAYARDKFRFKRWGRVKIEQQLRLKQLPESDIREALNDLYGEDYDSACLEILRQKSKSLKEADPYKRKAKLFRFAVGRGFDTETISGCLSQL